MALPAHHDNWGRPEPEWLSLQQAALIYGVSVGTLRRSITAIELPACRLGVRLIRVRTEELEQLFRPMPAAEPIHRHRRFGKL